MARGKSKPVTKDPRRVKGGLARAANMTPEQRSAAAMAAANARWAAVRGDPSFHRSILAQIEALKAKLPPSALEQRA